MTPSCLPCVGRKHRTRQSETPIGNSGLPSTKFARRRRTMPRINLLRDRALVLCCTLLVAPIVLGQQTPATPGNSYFCQFNDTSQRPNVTYYISRAFQTDASLVEVRQAWANYIRQTYAPDNNRDQGFCRIGAADQQQATEAQQRRVAQITASAQASAPHKNKMMQTVVAVVRGERGEDRFDVIPGEALGPAAPRGYSIAEMRGSYDPGSGNISGRTVTWLCNFRAVRDKAESAEIDKVMAAQRNPAPRPQIEAPQPSSSTSDREAKASAALPPAPKGLVRKSREYWRDYGTDIIRQVFDGGVGSQVDQYVEFRVLFSTYVEMFSAHCSAHLPPHHEAVTLTQVMTLTNRNGNVVRQQEGRSATVNVDPRFAAKYRDYAQFLISKAQSLGPGSASAFFDPGGDMRSFFQRETCRSAAMRQMGENLLRGATGERSLQQAGATIPGAAAETDPSAAPGRYARFVDACNAYYRDPANARLASPHSTQWCQCLSDQYRNTSAEDRYTNDFELFLKEVAPPSSTNPAWWKLYHGAVVECAR